MILGLAFSSGVFSVLLYNKYAAGGAIAFQSSSTVAYAEVQTPPSPQVTIVPQPTPAAAKSAMIKVPIINQNPELPSGCEVTSLTMLLQYKGIRKDKMQLAKEMKFDPTEITWDKNGNIAYWGNPNTGYVGDVYGNRKGFGIYHLALMDLLLKYIPSGVDLTRKDFSVLEQQVSNGIPVVVWTTINYTEPNNWVVWDSPLGPIKTTFSEHSVVLVGFDETHVYLNDPLSGKRGVAVDKALFIRSWEILGKQAISYTE